MKHPQLVLIGVFVVILISALRFVSVSIDNRDGSRGTLVTQSQDSAIEIQNNSTQESHGGELVVPAAKDSSCVILDDFNTAGTWRTVNDSVMGGRSLGGFSVADGILTHAGSINTNGGGFSSVRRSLPVNALSRYSHAIVRIDTDGRSYSLQFEDDRYRSVSHRFSIEPISGGGWQETLISFVDTVPTSFGRVVDVQRFSRPAINGLNFSLNDGIDGPFDISIDWIKLCA